MNLQSSYNKLDPLQTHPLGQKRVPRQRTRFVLGKSHEAYWRANKHTGTKVRPKLAMHTICEGCRT
jgi:hypothetical protein